MTVQALELSSGIFSLSPKSGVDVPGFPTRNATWPPQTNAPTLTPHNDPVACALLNSDFRNSLRRKTRAPEVGHEAQRIRLDSRVHDCSRSIHSLSGRRAGRHHSGSDRNGHEQRRTTNHERNGHCCPCAERNSVPRERHVERPLQSSKPPCWWSIQGHRDFDWIRAALGERHHTRAWPSFARRLQTESRSRHTSGSDCNG